MKVADRYLRKCGSGVIDSAVEIRSLKYDRATLAAVARIETEFSSQSTSLATEML